MEDREIIALLKERPEQGLREAIKQYRGLAVAVIGRMLRNEADCEECVADVFVGIWRRRDTLDASGSLKGYIVVTARNTAINRLKSNQTQREVFFEEDDWELPDKTDYAALLELKEDSKRLEKAVGRLKSPHREIFLYRYFLFFAPREIAAKLSIDEKQVKNSLYQSKKKMKKYFEGSIDHEK